MSAKALCCLQQEKGGCVKGYPMTPAGLKALQGELKNLKSVERPTVIKDIAEARAHGDLSENAEYDAAKERQGFVESRIRELEAKLAQCEVIDPGTLQGDRVMFGATVTILDCDTEQEQTWSIVGEDEANLKEHKLSVTSPLARALISKSVGDDLQVRTPKGMRECEILEVRYLAQADVESCEEEPGKSKEK